MSQSFTSDIAQQYDLNLDEASATISYVGQAAPGSSAAAAVWRIKRIDSTSGIIITWADGNDAFDKIWNDRATYTYS